MSIDIDLQEDPESNGQPPDRLSGILSILLAVLLLVAAVVVVLVAQQRVRQAAVLKATPTAAATVKSVGSPVPLLTPAATTKSAGSPTVVSTAAATAKPAGSPAAPSTAAATAKPAGSPAAPSTAAATAKPAGSPAAATATQPAATTVARFSPTPAATRSVVAPAATAVATRTGTSPTPPPLPATATTVAAPAPAAARAWYFSEGASVSPFRTTYAIYNPGTAAANVTVTLYPESGKTVAKTLAIGAGAQARVLANEILPNSVFGAAISSDQQVYVERITLGDRDGTASPGMTPSSIWYFPEGQTGDDFTTWLVVLNPAATPAALTVTYYPVEGTAIVKKYTAPPTARLTIAAQADVEMGVMGIVVESNQPVVAEHGIYFDGQKAAYGGAGLTTPSKTWYAAAGNTQPGFTARIAVFNTSKSPATVKVTLIGSKQAAVSDLYSIEPLSKDDIVINDRADEQLVAAVLESDQPIVAQAISYYISGSETGPVAAHSASLIAALSTQWYLPNVLANTDTDPYITLFNPGKASAKVTLTYVVQGGAPVSKLYDLAASGRLTLRVSDEVKGAVALAAAVSSTQPIAVEHVTMLRTSVGATAAEGAAAR